jgi:prophage regulatory protein
VSARVPQQMGLAEVRRVVRGERILSLPALCGKVGDLSKSTVWEMVRDEDFPAPVQLSANRIGWLESEVDEWIAALVRSGRERVTPIRAGVRREERKGGGRR